VASGKWQAGTVFSLVTVRFIKQKIGAAKTGALDKNLKK
jgi:hypothetical protein